MISVTYVPLLWYMMVPIDCKTTNFLLYLFVYFFVNNCNIGELTNDHE